MQANFAHTCAHATILMRKRLHIFSLGLMLTALVSVQYVSAQTNQPMLPDTAATDTASLPPMAENIDSLAAASDSTHKKADYPPVRISNQLDAKIDYAATDSFVMLGNGTAMLHGGGDMSYKTINLTADFVRMKMDSATLYAAGVYDSIDEEWTGRPVFKEGESSYECYELSYGLKSKKAYIRHVVAEQDEGYIIADKAKKTGDDELMMADGKYTTCDDHEHPHFYLNITKGKVKPGEYVASGPAYLVVGDVPLPLAIPFGFFPFTSTYSSGLIMPSFGDDQRRGLYLRGLGYYFALCDYADLEVTGDIYTKGTWSVAARSRYVKRYKFSGSISANYRSDVEGEKGMPDYSKAKNFSLQWTHTQDTKANPYSSFSASVNFSTSGYNRSNINSYYNAALNSENTKQSTINYTQRFPDSPWSLSMNASLSQRTKDSTVSLTLPNLNVTMSQIYPFKRKNKTGKDKWYEKIAMRYTANGLISIANCKEDYLFHSNFLRDWKASVKHSIPINASFTAFKYLNISPSINYNERWYFQRVDQSWDDMQNEIVRDTTNGFYRVWDLSMSLSMSTKLYGFFIPSRKLFPNSKVDRFRHVFTPSISLNYTPDCESIREKINHNYYGFYEKPVTYTDGTVGYETVQYNRFNGYETPGRGNTGSLSFSLGNNLEMKVLNEKDTTGKNPTKIISLIDNLAITGGYNFMADSMNWSNFGVSLRIKLPFNYTLNLSGQFDPYLYGINEAGRPVRTNRRCWQEGKFLHFKGTSTSFSYTFNNQVFRKWFKLDEKKESEKFDPGWDMDDPFATDPNTGELITDEQREQAKLQEKEWKKSHRGDNSASDDGDWEFAEIPWSLTLNYNIRYGESNVFDYEKMNYKMRFTHNLSANISLGLGRGWKASTSLSYDFAAKKLSNATINVTRDLHCWTMTASFVPFGPYKSYTFHIGVNASMLSDLKYDTSSADATNNHVNWW